MVKLKSGHGADRSPFAYGEIRHISAPWSGLGLVVDRCQDHAGTGKTNTGRHACARLSVWMD